MGEALHWSKDPSYLALAPLAGLGVGVGARLIKHLIEQRKSKIRPLNTPETQVPVEVTPEEAMQLQQQGQEVKAANFLDTAQESIMGGPTSSAMGGAVRGALGTGAAIGGYALIDSLIDRARKKQLRQDIDHLRGRLSNVLQDQPATEDIPLHAQMKAAEDLHFGKRAGAGVNLVDSLLPASLAAAGGGAAVLSALGAFRHVREENPNAQRISDLRSLMRQSDGPSKLTLTPVVSKVKLLALLKNKHMAPEAVEAPKLDYAAKLERMRQRQDPDGIAARKQKEQVQPAMSPSAQADSSMAF